MNYQQEVQQFKSNSLLTFKQHIEELENNVLKAAEIQSDKTKVAELYVEYQQKTVMLIANKFKIDNEYLKDLNTRNLDANKNVDPETFLKIQEVLVKNHVQILSELKTQYELYCEQSRESLRQKLATENPQSSLRVNSEIKPLFGKRVSYINLSFLLLLLILLAIVYFVYVTYFI